MPLMRTTTIISLLLVVTALDAFEMTSYGSRITETRTLAVIALRVKDPAGQEIIFEDCTEQNLKDWWYGTDLVSDTCQKCRDSKCANTANFVDAQGYECSDWSGYDCTNYEGYTPDQMSDIRENCALTCAPSACPKPGAEEWFDNVFRGTLAWNVSFHTATINNYLSEGECKEKYSWRDGVAKAIAAANVDPNSQHVLMFAPPDWEKDSCGTSELPAGGGLGDFGGRDAFTDRECEGSAYDRSTAVHEIAHNLKLHHAAIHLEGGEFIEYGECGDIMGYSTSSWMVALNAPHMSQKKLLFAGELLVPSNGTYTLHYLYHPKKGTLRVLRFYDVMLSYRWKTPSFPYTQDMDRCDQISERINVHRLKGDQYTHLTNLVKVGERITIDGVDIHFVSQDGNGTAVVTLTGLENRPTQTCSSFNEWSNTLKSCSNVKHCVHLVKTKEYGKCSDYCASLPGHGHTCFYAAEESYNQCWVKHEASCDTDIKKEYGTSDMLCGCAMDKPATTTTYLTTAPTTTTTTAPTTTTTTTPTTTTTTTTTPTTTTTTTNTAATATSNNRPSCKLSQLKNLTQTNIRDCCDRSEVSEFCDAIVYALDECTKKDWSDLSPKKKKRKAMKCCKKFGIKSMCNEYYKHDGVALSDDSKHTFVMSSSVILFGVCVGLWFSF